MEDELQNYHLDICLGKCYDVSTGGKDIVWRPKAGKPLKVSEMPDAHLANAINYIRLKYDPMENMAHSEMSAFNYSFVEQAGDVLASKFGKVLSHVRSMADYPRYKFLWEEALKRGLVNEND